MMSKNLLFLAILIILLFSSCIVVYEGAYCEASDVNFHPAPEPIVIVNQHFPPAPHPQTHYNPPPPKPYRPNAQNDNNHPRVPSRKPSTSSSRVNKKPVRQR
ncbi:MAG: hypothetical protein U9N51_00050 [Bacteroidota bacterium]|nr:hypothetical protein [Bacteroidota bacterium]